MKQVLVVITLIYFKKLFIYLNLCATARLIFYAIFLALKIKGVKRIGSKTARIDSNYHPGFNLCGGGGRHAKYLLKIDSIVRIQAFNIIFNLITFKKNKLDLF